MKQFIWVQRFSNGTFFINPSVVPPYLIKGPCSGGALLRVTILAEWLRYFNALAMGETAAPACFLRENAEGAGMPPLLRH